MGRVAHLRLAKPPAPSQQGLRAALRHERGLDLSGHGPPHATPSCSLL